MRALGRFLGMSSAWGTLGVLFLWGLLGMVWLSSSLLLGQFLGGYIGGPLVLSILIFAVFLWKKRMVEFSMLAGITVFVAMAFYFWLEPSNERQWEMEMERLPIVTFKGERIEIRDLRDFRWVGDGQAEPHWKDAWYDLERLNLLEVLVEPFGDSEFLAHVFLSFGFSDGKRLVVSIEARRERGETYGLLAGAARQFELMYIFATEEDVVDLRARYRGSRVYSYPLRVDDDFKKRLLVGLCQSANALHEQPAFYATIRDNCTTTLFKHANENSSKKVGWRLEALFPAKLGALIYELGLMDTNLTFEEARESFRIKEARH